MPLKILHNLCFSSLLGITAVPREIENNDYANFGGQISCIMGDVQVAYNCIIDVNCIDIGFFLPNLVKITELPCLLLSLLSVNNCTIDVNCIDVDKLLPNLVVACRISWGVYKRVNILNE